MNYPPRFRYSQKPSKVLLFFSLALIGLILVFFGRQVNSIFAPSIHYLSVPFSFGDSVVSKGGNSIFTLFFSKEKLIEENAALKAALEENKSKLFDREILYEENLNLKESLGRVSRSTTTLATVLLKPNRSPYDTFIIDIGSNSGVVVGDAVFAPETVALGRVATVFKDTSIVKLFSSPGEESNVTIGTGIEATAIGRGSGNFEVKLPRGIDVAEGDIVIIPGISPKVFGVVERVDAKPTDTFQNIYFKNPINFVELRFVFVSHSR